MFLPWTDFLTFLVNNLNDLLETEIAQVRYGDVGLATALAIAVGIAAVAALARLVFRRQRHTRYHSGHEIDPKYQRAFGFVRFIRCPNCVLVAL